jgi:hypothetical protein
MVPDRIISQKTQHLLCEAQILDHHLCYLEQHQHLHQVFNGKTRTGTLKMDAGYTCNRNKFQQDTCFSTLWHFNIHLKICFVGLYYSGRHRNKVLFSHSLHVSAHTSHLQANVIVSYEHSYAFLTDQLFIFTHFITYYKTNIMF